MNKKGTIITVWVSVVITFAAITFPGGLAVFAATPFNSYQNAPIDFRHAAAVSTQCVVHIKSICKVENIAFRSQQDPFGFFQFFQGANPFQIQQQSQMTTGSGVIASKDGYIVTNNHVIDGATGVDVVLNNNKSYKARIVGKDPDTDIALIKIEDSNDLPFIQFANSDSVEVGEWVLAVGNPFNLSSTVTAGIVSAKGRNIDLRKNNMTNEEITPIESFIQTDAAVNPGNSGGALVNMLGELVGITTAIASPTGSYAGYSFAVPSNIVKKVVFDLEKYGVSQRGFLGLAMKTMDDVTARQVNFDKPYGVFVEGVNKGSASDQAGLKQRDVITKINGVIVNSEPELQEQLALYRPGDNVIIEYIRDGKTETASVTLKNKYNNTSSVDNSQDMLNSLGIRIENLTDGEKRAMGLQGGVKITDMKTAD